MIEEVIQDRKGLDFPKGGNGDAKPLTAESTKETIAEIRQRLENVEDTVRVLQTQMAWLTTALSEITEAVKDGPTQETNGPFSLQKESSDNRMSGFFRLREKIESLERPQTAKIGRILMPSADEPNYLVKGKKQKRIAV